MSVRTITDCKKLIAESGLPYRIIRFRGIYRLTPFVIGMPKGSVAKRIQAKAENAEAIIDVDKLYKQLSLEAEELAKAIEEANGINLKGLSDEELAKHMDKPNE